MNKTKNSGPSEPVPRIIGLDMHPDVFTAAALDGESPDSQAQWIHDRRKTRDLESWARQHLRESDVSVLEASGNSFEIARRLTALGLTVIVLESQQAGKLRENYCNNDKSSAVKLARAYLSGLCKIVWQPDEKTRQWRDIFFAHRNSVKDTTRGRNRIRGHLNTHCVRLPPGTRLTRPSGLATALALRDWSDPEAMLIEDLFDQLWFQETRRKKLEKIMVQSVLSDQRARSLLRLRGIRHINAFALIAILGDIARFETPKKLVGYLGLCPGLTQSGNNKEGRKRGLLKKGRRDLRSLLIQSAQAILRTPNNPLHDWGLKLFFKKGNRNVAVAGVARKLVVSIWYLLKGHFTPLETTAALKTKLLKLASLLGKARLKENGFKNRNEFLTHHLQLLKESP